MRFRTKHGNVYYWRIPFGEIQYGRMSGKIVIWFMRRSYMVRKPDYDKFQYRTRRGNR